MTVMQDNRKLIVGNWKMHGDSAMALLLTEEAATCAAKARDFAQVVLCPPATLMHMVARTMIGSLVHMGGQDCSPAAEGAYTGDISVTQLKEAGCSYVIVGHSERRAMHHETNEIVCAKSKAAIGAGLIPIICIGETLVERDAGKAQEIVSKQLKESLPQGHFIVAYEPVWAIGTGRNASPADIESMHAHIAANTPKGTQILYGGSVKAANAREILTIKGVSGVLVGGASLKPEEFNVIIESAA